MKPLDHKIVLLIVSKQNVKSENGVESGVKKIEGNGVKP